MTEDRISFTTVADVRRLVAHFGLKKHIVIDENGGWHDCVENVSGVGAVALTMHVLDLAAADAIAYFRELREIRSHDRSAIQRGEADGD